LAMKTKFRRRQLDLSWESKSPSGSVFFGPARPCCTDRWARL